MKILATADMHLGMKFSTYDEVREELTGARYTALKRCVEAANDEKCDLLVIAGDLFDRQNVSGSDIARAAGALSGFTGSALLVLPGNHDFFTGTDGKPWGDFMRECESASAPVVLLSNTRPYNLDHFDLPVMVMPGPCTKKHSDTDAVSWILKSDAKPGEDKGRIVLGIAHGSLEGLSPDFDGDYFPMTMKQLEDAPVDLWIIGHTHRPFPEEGTVNPRLFIPGTPEPDGFDCRHGGGAWILECAGPKVESYRRIDTGTYRFYREEVEVEQAAAISRAVSAEEPEASLVSLKITGALNRQEYEKLPAVLEELATRHFYFRAILDDLEEVVSRETVDEEFTDGSFAHRLISAFLEEGDVEAAQIAYRFVREAGG